ncbi:MAG: hypothetical protein ACRED1_07440, partial [Limisphaerales bacterium]
MAKTLFASSPLPGGFALAAIHRMDDSVPLRICVLLRTGANAAEGPFVILRDLPGARVHLGAICDSFGNIQQWVEIHVQVADAKELDYSGRNELLTNAFFDLRWDLDSSVLRDQLAETVIATRMETDNPGPILIKGSGENGPFVPTEVTPWRVCKDEELLKSNGLPGYSTSPFRYLFQPESKGANGFIATAVEAPVPAAVQGPDHLKSGPDVRAVFNPGGGLVRVVRHSPMEVESYLQILEGRPWNEAGSEMNVFSPGGIYAALRDWSVKPRGLPFLLHGKAAGGERLNEIFLLKLQLLYDL